MHDVLIRLPLTADPSGIGAESPSSMAAESTVVGQRWSVLQKRGVIWDT